MTEAVAARLNELLASRNMSKKDLYNSTTLSRDTVQSVYKNLAKSVTLTTLDGICQGLGITMSEFLDCEYFKGKTEAPEEEPRDVKSDTAR